RRTMGERWRRGGILEGASPVVGTGDDAERYAPRWRPREGPQDPSQSRHRGLQGRIGPRGASVGADLDAGDPAVPRESDASDRDRPANDRVIRRRGDDRDRVDQALLDPIRVVRVRPPLLLPVSAEFSPDDLDLRDPFRVKHPVQAGYDDPSRVS